VDRHMVGVYKTDTTEEKTTPSGNGMET